MAKLESSLGDERERIRLLLRALRSLDADCRSVLGKLDDYVSAQIEEGPYTQLFPEVAAHLDGCLACAEIYAALYEIASDPASLPEPPPSRAAPQLDFLRPSATIDLRAALTDAMEQVGQRLRLTLSPLLLPPLRPALATERSSSDRYAEKILEVDESLFGDRSERLGLAAYRDRENPEHCLVEISVKIGDRSWPELGGIPVTLQLAGRTIEQRTDPSGVAPFEDIPIDELERLVVEIEI